jgi:hypothetical protein
MYGANHNLEFKIKDNTATPYKSKGERKIAYFFDNNSIKYQYEPAVLVNTNNNRSRIWYPDFYLPEFKTYLEYFGLVGQPGYDDGIKKKLSTYLKMGLDVISLYPRMFNKDWKGYIMKELEKWGIHFNGVIFQLKEAENYFCPQLYLYRLLV